MPHFVIRAWNEQNQSLVNEPFDGTEVMVHNIFRQWIQDIITRQIPGPTGIFRAALLKRYPNHIYYEMEHYNFRFSKKPTN